MDSFQVMEMYIFIAILLMHILTECKLFDRWMKLLKNLGSVNIARCRLALSLKVD